MLFIISVQKIKLFKKKLHKNGIKITKIMVNLFIKHQMIPSKYHQ
jgi:hypothetical protein